MNNITRIEWNVTPVGFLAEVGWSHKLRGRWLDLKLCPLCGGGDRVDTHTFAVHAEDGNYVCQRSKCGSKGNFWMLIELAGRNPRDFIGRRERRREDRKLGKRRKLTIAAEITTVAGSPKKFREPTIAIDPLSMDALEYLTKTRKLSRDTLSAYRVGCTKDGKIAIPFFDEKDVRWLVKFRHANGRMLKLRDRELKTFTEPGGRPVLLGSHLCAPSAGPLVISFGDYDAMSIHEAGVPNSVSVPFGDTGFDWIREQWDFLETFELIILYTDADTFPNRKAEARAKQKLDELADRLGKHRLKLVTLKAKKGTKDPNDLLIKFGKNAIVDAIDGANWYPEQDLVAVADYQDEPITVGRRTGFGKIDRRTGGCIDGHLMLIAGDNGAGKTTLALTIIVEHVEQGAPVFIWSGEQRIGRLRYWLERIAAGPAWLKRVSESETGFEYFFPTEEVQAYIRDWYRDYLFQYGNFFTDVEKFFRVAELAIRRFGVKLIVIDNLMAFTGGEGENYYQAQGDFAQRCKLFAETWNVTVILIVHNRKPERIKNPDSTVSIPTKDDVEGSKKVTNWADLILQHKRIPKAVQTSNPEWLDVDAVVGVVKCRETGDLFSTRLRFEASSMRLVAIDEEAKLAQEYSWLQEFEKGSPSAGSRFR